MGMSSVHAKPRSGSITKHAVRQLAQSPKASLWILPAPKASAAWVGSLTTSDMPLYHTDAMHEDAAEAALQAAKQGSKAGKAVLDAMERAENAHNQAKGERCRCCMCCSCTLSI